MPRFQIGETIYNTAALDELSLKDIVLFDSQAAEIGLDARWSDLEQAATDMSALSADEADRHPRKILVIAVTIWAARRMAGEQIKFGDAIDFPANSMRLLPEVGDKKPGKPKAAKKAAKKSPKASAPVVEPAAIDEATTPATSGPKSDPA